MFYSSKDVYILYVMTIIDAHSNPSVSFYETQHSDTDMRLLRLHNTS